MILRTTPASDITHERLVELAHEYAVGEHGWGCALAICNALKLGVVKRGERPDVIGWMGHVSYLVECKRTVEDRRADDAKGHRQPGARSLGHYRYLLTPTWLNVPTPLGWGHLETDGLTIWETGDPEPNDMRDRDGEIAILVAHGIGGGSRVKAARPVKEADYAEDVRGFLIDGPAIAAAIKHCEAKAFVGMTALAISKMLELDIKLGKFPGVEVVPFTTPTLFRLTTNHQEW